MTRPFRTRERLNSFIYAGRGVVTLFRTQHNMWLHGLATLGVCAVAFVLDVARTDWLWLLLAIAFVWVAEAFNTAIEFLADAVTTDYRREIELAKDVAAGAVLLAALFALLTALIVFPPYVFSDAAC